MKPFSGTFSEKIYLQRQHEMVMTKHFDLFASQLP